jgi:hypothetical protein
MAGTLAGLALFVWLSVIKVDGTRGFPVLSLLGLAVPLASIGLGAWTWRDKKVRVFASVYAVATGAGALVIAALFVIIGFIFMRLF